MFNYLLWNICLAVDGLVIHVLQDCMSEIQLCLRLISSNHISNVFSLIYLVCSMNITLTFVAACGPRETK